MRILFLAPYYPPEIGGGSVRFSGLVRWLRRFGHSITVLTAIPNYPTGVIPREYRGRWWLWDTVEDAPVLRSWVYASSNQSSLGRMANYITLLLSTLIAGLLLKRRFDVIVAGMPPLLLAVTGWLLAVRHRVPWVLDIGDLWPEVAVDAGEWRPDAPITVWTRRLARFLYRRSDHLTPVTDSKRDKLIGMGIPGQKITVVANGADLDLDPGPDVSWRDKLGLQDRFVVMYAGLVGIAQGVDIVVDAALILKDCPDAAFLVVGEGVRYADIIRRKEHLSLHNLALLPGRPRQEILSLLNTMDASLVPLVSPQIADAVPSKMLEAWACKKPVILCAAGESARLIDQSGGGIVVQPGNAGELAEAVRQLAADRRLAAQMGESGYRFVRAHFDREMLTRQMEDVLKRLVVGGDG